MRHAHPVGALSLAPIQSLAFEVIAPGADAALETSLRVLKLERRLARERAARLEAEAIAERGLRDLYEKQRALELLGSVAAIANGAHEVEETLRYAVEALCAHTGWQFGNVYALATDGAVRLVATPVWHATDPGRVAPFIELSQATEFPSGRGLPGRVLASGIAHWIPDVTVDPNFPRAPVAEACGLHAAFAFPILVGAETVAVMEFFSRDVAEPDPALLALVGQVGTQLGRVMERKRAKAKLIHDARHDSLTGLPNRHQFAERLGDAIARREADPSAEFALLFVDLDRFKLVNDSLGHAAGDALLMEVGRRLADALRPLESAGFRATLARLGGDEFTVLIEGEASERQAEASADAIQASLRAPVILEGQDIHTTASIGLATSTSSLSEIMRDADLAMYRAKAEGRARTAVFDTRLHEAARKRLRIERELRHALERSEFVAYYQPIVRLADLALVGFEALLRWQREDGAFVGPGDFIGIAEDAGLIVPIGEWIMREALGACGAWNANRPSPLSVSVNVSARQFRQADFLAGVTAALHDTRVDPTLVRMELTESAMMENPERAAELFAALRALGPRISIDDFGTGYSSLAYLNTLPVDVLKIDRSFVAGMGVRSGSRQIVQTVIDMARNLGMEVIAEGTETAAQVRELKTMRCGFAQGFHFAKPLPPEETARLVAATASGRTLSGLLPRA